jgi:hypothetical protein
MALSQKQSSYTCHIMYCGALAQRRSSSSLLDRDDGTQSRCGRSDSMTPNLGVILQNAGSQRIILNTCRRCRKLKVHNRCLKRRPASVSPEGYIIPPSPIPLVRDAN